MKILLISLLLIRSTLSYAGDSDCSFQVIIENNIDSDLRFNASRTIDYMQNERGCEETTERRTNHFTITFKTGLMRSYKNYVRVVWLNINLNDDDSDLLIGQRNSKKLSKSETRNVDYNGSQNYFKNDKHILKLLQSYEKTIVEVLDEKNF